MRYALVQDGVACNVILWDGEDEYEAPDGCQVIEVNDEVSPGWLWDGHTWKAPLRVETPIPEEAAATLLAKEQAAANLVALGVSLENARTIVGLPNG